MEKISISVNINSAIQKVWDHFNNPNHIVNWNFAHESWHCPKSENSLEIAGQFNHRMEAKDGSFGFDLIGIYDEIIPNQLLKYHLEDGRNVEVQFNKIDENSTEVIETFEAETQNPVEMQRDGWLAILTNFKNYVEKSS